MKNEDIVTKEAFEVLKRDFIKQINHKNLNVEKALFPKYNRTNGEQQDFLQKIIENNDCFTEMVEDLVQQTDSFEEFIIEFRMLNIFVERLMEQTKRTEGLLEMLIKMDKDLEEHIRRQRGDDTDSKS